ncbi:MAG TPA: hypothetical protein VMF52_11320 [Steroidobacteraceae bacterium]|nr:hypothetical protein [Steroidobacteraceae bacterium]
MNGKAGHWIQVTISSGMFSSEKAVELKLADGRKVSFFADNNLLEERAGRSYLKVTLVNSDPGQKTDLVLLPSETFETASPWAEVPAA